MSIIVLYEVIHIEMRNTPKETISNVIVHHEQVLKKNAFEDKLYLCAVYPTRHLLRMEIVYIPHIAKQYVLFSLESHW